MMVEDIAVRALGVSCIAVSLVLFVMTAIPQRRSPSRRQRRAAAKKALAQVRLLKTAPLQLAHLRRLPPAVFDETVLIALADHSRKTRRSMRRLGPESLGGRATIAGQSTIIQTNPDVVEVHLADVDALVELCRKSGSSGLFVHTGRTSKLALGKAMGEGIDVVSGKRLLDLIIGRGYERRCGTEIVPPAPSETVDVRHAVGTRR